MVLPNEGRGVAGEEAAGHASLRWQVSEMVAQGTPLALDPHLRRVGLAVAGHAADGPADAVPLYLVHAASGYGFLLAGDGGPVAMAVDEDAARAVVAVRLEDEADGLRLLQPVPARDLLAGDGPQAFGLRPLPPQLEASLLGGPVTRLLASLSARPGGLLGAEALLAALAAHADLALALLCLLDDPSLLRLVPRLAGAPGYAAVFPALRDRLSGGMPQFPRETARLLRHAVELWGWSIGEHSYGEPVVLDGANSHLTIGRYCSIAGNVVVALGNHEMRSATTYPFATLRRHWPSGQAVAELDDHIAKPVVIGNDVWIGYGAVILPGTIIGDGSVVGANAVVRGNIAPYSVVAGNPARLIRKRFDDATIDRLLTLRWWDWPDEKIDRYLPLLVEPEIGRFLDAAEAGEPVCRPAGRNLALKRPTRQSSTLTGTAFGSCEAALAVNGTLTGSWQSHTGWEDEPWWDVDLGKPTRITHVMIYNTLEAMGASRLSRFRLLASRDDRSWTVLHERTDPHPFGGIDGRPFVWSDLQGVMARWVRVQLTTQASLQIDQVEIYAQPPG